MNYIEIDEELLCTRRKNRLADIIIRKLKAHNKHELFTMKSGTTSIARKNLDRNFINIGLDKKYFKIAEQRINKEVIHMKLGWPDA